MIGVEEKETWPDGDETWVSTTKIPIFRESGEVIGTCGISRNITERKEMEEALRTSERRLQLSLEATNDALWDWNIETGKVYFSPRYYTMLGYTPYELPESYETWEGLLHPADMERATTFVMEHIEAKRSSFELSSASEPRTATGAGSSAEERSSNATTMDAPYAWSARTSTSPTGFEPKKRR